MGNPSKTNHGSNYLSATNQGPKPGDFPTGSLKSRAAARAIVAGYADAREKQEDLRLKTRTPFQEAISEMCDEPDVKAQLILLARGVEERYEIFGFQLPSPEEIRHGHAVAKEINRMTDGKPPSLGDFAEWSRLRSIAEENLRRNVEMTINREL